MQLIPWSHRSSAGFTLRGWRSPPSGKPLLHFLHGNGFCGRTYDPMLTRLTDTFDLWLSDIQGHGDSEHGERFLGWNRNAELAVEAFETGRGEYGLVPRHALGHSFGGVLTALLLARHPGLFERAVLLDPVLFSPTMTGLVTLMDVAGLYRRNRMAKRAGRRRHQWLDRTAASEGLRGRGMFAGWTEAALSAYVQHALRETPEGVELCCRPAREAEIFGSFPFGMWAALKRVRTPTLVVVGADSYPFVHKATQRWCRLNDRIRQQTVPGGHCFMQEDPDSAARRVLGYLTQQTSVSADARAASR